jgi:GxxExxY protein
MNDQPKSSHKGTETPKDLLENEIGAIIVDTAVKLHKKLGPGLLETVYEVILAYELEQQNLTVKRQVIVPIEYNGLKFDEGFRADMVINDKVIIELKSVEMLNNAHKKQVLTCLRLTGKKLGYLLNFGEALMKNGIVRVINGNLK